MWARFPALTAVALCAALWAPAARAGLFEDDEARHAINELRAKVEQLNEAQRTLQAEQISQLKRSLLDLNNQLEQQRADNAALRGQLEQLAREVAELQRKQKDMQSGVDERMRRIEPQKVTLDGREFNAEPDEKRLYDEAMDAFRKGEFASTAIGLTALRKRYPASGYGESAMFWLGNAQYGLRQYKDAIATFRALVSSAPEYSKSPEALLSIANSQAELNDAKAARRTIDELIKTYPKSEAAHAGKERLVSLK